MPRTGAKLNGSIAGLVRLSVPVNARHGPKTSKACGLHRTGTAMADRNSSEQLEQENFYLSLISTTREMGLTAAPK